MPSRFFTSGRKFSTTTSAFLTMRLNAASPSGLFRFSVMLRLLRWRFWKSPPSRGPPIGSSTPGGVSILMTLAPQSASWRTQVGPDRTRVRSSTVKRARAFEARGNGIATPPTPVRCRPILPAKAPGRPEFPRSWQYCPPAPGARLGRRFGTSTWIKCHAGRPSFRHFHEAIMNEEILNVSVRRFLKKVGITSQREIEQAVRSAIAAGRLRGNEALPAKAVLTISDIGLSVEIDDAVELE